MTSPDRLPIYPELLGETSTDFVDCANRNLERWLAGHRELNFLAEARHLLERAEQLDHHHGA